MANMEAPFEQIAANNGEHKGVETQRMGQFSLVKNWTTSQAEN